jgi:hypothetical protein
MPAFGLGKEGFITVLATGATLTAQVPEPAVDLAAVVQFLSIAVPTRPVAPGDPNAATDGWPLLDWNPDQRVLGINTYGVIRRLRHNREAAGVFRKRFTTNARVPKADTKARLGGRILPNTETQLRAAVERLVRNVDQEIDRVTQSGFDPRQVANQGAGRLLDAVAAQLGIPQNDRLQGPTRIVGTRLVRLGDRHAPQGDVARYVAAIETVAGTRQAHLGQFLSAVETRLRQQNYPDGTVRGALAENADAANTTGGQLSRFFDFLENEALARIRLHVTRRLMEAVASQAEERQSAHPDPDLAVLVAYVRRASELLDLLRAEGLPLNLSQVFGAAGDLDLLDQVGNAGFVNCLPIWTEYETQMFEQEQHPTGTDPGETTRELTYRFRVNGVAPSAPGMRAFDHRLWRIEHAWLQLGPDGVASEAYRVARSLAELVFLWAVIPDRADTARSGEDALAAAQELARRVNKEGLTALRQALAELRERSSVVDQATTGLIRLLKTRGRVLARSALNQQWTYYLNVSRELVDLPRFASVVDRPLNASAAPGKETLDFLRHVEVWPDRANPHALLSIQVRVQLSEYSVQALGKPEVLALSRRRPELMAQVVWRPFRAVRTVPEHAGWRPALPPERDQAWLAPGRIEVQYAAREIGWPGAMQASKDLDALQNLAAVRTAFAVLVYVTLLRLFQRTGERPTVSVLRIQQQGRSAEKLGGEEAVYAAAQATEAVLGRDADLRMQGLVLDEGVPDRYKLAGAYAALFAGFPLHIEQRQGERPTAGVVSFAARPCNEHPDLLDAPGEQLVVARSYLAAPSDTPVRGYELRCAGTSTGIVGAEAAVPVCVEDEVARLYAGGCRHLILVEHRFGERRTGGHATHARLRIQNAAMRLLAERYSDLVVYPLVRDTFSATRLRSRDTRIEDAFEILRPAEHLDALSDAARALRRDFTPVYSLATLHVVGGSREEFGKPQSGYCTYYLRRDNEASAEAGAVLAHNLIAPSSPVRSGLLSVLRGIHYLEAERSVTPRAVQPVLDPYDWMAPESAGKVGEVVVFERTGTPMVRSC